MDSSSYLSLPETVEGSENDNPSYLSYSNTPKSLSDRSQMAPKSFPNLSMEQLLAQLADAREKIRHQEATIASLLTQNNHHVQTILNQQATIAHQIQAFKDLGAIRALPSSAALDHAISLQLQAVKDLVTVPGSSTAAVGENSMPGQIQMTRGVTGSDRSQITNSVIDHTFNHTVSNYVELASSPNPPSPPDTATDPSPAAKATPDTKSKTKTKGKTKPKQKTNTKNIKHEDHHLDNNGDNSDVPNSTNTPISKVGKRPSGPHTCNHCSKVFSHKGHFNRHIATHTGERRYACNVCDKAFAQGWHLERHKRGHTQERPFKCDVCEKPFGDISHLAAHKRIHLAEKPYKCNDCGRTFAHTNTLKTHKRTHTKEKPYHCVECEMKFTTSSQLKSHKKVHMLMDKVEKRRGMRLRKVRLLKDVRKVCSKEFLCVVCNEGFDEHNELRTHMEIHVEPVDV